MIKIIFRRPWQRERMNQSHNNNYEFVISLAAADEQGFFCAVLGAAGRWALCGCSGNAQTLRRSMGCHLPLPYQWWNDGDAPGDDDNEGGLMTTTTMMMMISR